MTSEPLLTVADVAKLLNVRPGWVYAEVESTDGTLPFNRVGRYIRFERPAIERWLEAARQRVGQ